MRSLTRGLVIVLTIPIVHGGAFQGGPPLDPLPSKNPSWEHLRSTVPVAGNIRAGIMVENPGKFDPANPSLVVFLPEKPDSEGEPQVLCVEVNSQDGRYTGSREFTVAGQSGAVALKFPTKHGSALGAYEPGQLAILGRLGTGCDGKTEAFVVASWQSRPIGSKILVFLNSRLPTFIAAQSVGGAVVEAPCVPLTEPTTAYNLRCEIPRDWVSPAQSKTMKVKTRRGANFTELDLLVKPPSEKPSK